MNVTIENIKRTQGNWDAVFDVVLSFEEDRSIRIGCCGAEIRGERVYFRLPTKVRRDTNETYQLNFFDKQTWEEIIRVVEGAFTA